METAFGKIEGLSGVTYGTINAFPPRANDIFEVQKAEALWTSEDSDSDSESDSTEGTSVTPVICAC
jgi:hypothetical protein